MDLNKNNVKKILFIVAVSILFFTGIQHLDKVASGLGYVFDLLNPFIIGVCIAFIVNVPLKLIEERVFGFLNRKNHKIWNKIKRGVCLLITFAIVIGIVFFIAFIIIPQCSESVDLLAKNIPSYITNIQNFIAEISNKFSIDFSNISFDWASLGNKLTEFLQNQSAIFINTTVGVTSSIFSGIFNFVIGIAFSIYILAQKEKLSMQFKRLFYAYIKKDKVDKGLELAYMTSDTFEKFVKGQFTEAIIIGVLCFIGMLIFGMPYAPMIAVLVGFTALIPVFGAFIGTGIGAFLILMVNPLKAVWFVIFIIVLQQLEGNLIYPKVVGTSVGLPGIWVLAAVTLGGNFGGIFGMLLSVPLSSIIYNILRKSVFERLKIKKIKVK